jgi:hypothetical protein
VIRIVLAILLAPALARADEPLVHAELDPLTFANRGYGAQIGIRHPALRGVRLAIASFSLHVPDPIAQIGNAGFDERVRPSGAIYALYYFASPSHDGFAAGASIRYLRIRYAQDDEPGLSADVSQISPEAIVAYQWHPFHNGFYLQPWFALGVTLWSSGDGVVGGHRYDPLPVSPFFTVNIGYELAP